MRKHLAIYPFSFETSPIVRYSDLLYDYEITKVFAPKSFGLNNRDISKADGGRDMGLTISDDMESSLGEYDVLLLDYHPLLAKGDGYAKILNIATDKELIIPKSMSST